LVTEGYSQSSFWVCFKKSSATSRTQSNVGTHLFEV